MEQKDGDKGREDMEEEGGAVNNMRSRPADAIWKEAMEQTADLKEVKRNRVITKEVETFGSVTNSTLLLQRYTYLFPPLSSCP